MANPIVSKNIADDVIEAPGGKRKMSSEQINVIKKPKESKKLPNKLCQCPQKCSVRIPQQSKDELLKMFVEMNSEEVQNTFLLKIIKAQPVANRLFSNEISNGKLLRRIHCKYRIPYIVSDDLISNINSDSDEVEESDFDETSSGASLDSKDENDKSLEGDSMEVSRKLLNHFNCVDVCQKAFINLFGLSDKRLKTVRELLIAKARRKYMKRMMEKEENQIEVSLAKGLAESCLPLIGLFNTEDRKIVSDQLLTAINNDINLVNNFFYNQLWKPEYLQ
ncbi:uncharacterized protein LOC132935102 [Metopolophium dirhodum]|uniref:uncharacterized protein LOC132935102 n=1 Tax=Metopolophium dirhodum TaxID=44670 RepID=UPI00298F9797|nr:uncharacterized protein LOC132935102 [Metopolophium dirhodum]